ncbi:glycosyltransferase family 4 protein [Inquilinus limosus]|uniref:glycosyltransferase family 4 protein n=1 Tax=Inquilinus limosus TaxID=171674 RepID=UPI00041D0A27|nr:glycosyltransferase family 4 protein [Inquilinus limosus]
MRIAQIAPLCEAVPPRLYGGAERIVAILCDTLTDLGHDVTLFASADSRSRARLVSVRDQATRLDPNPLKCELAAHLAMLHEVRQRADEFDIFHFHIDLLHFPLFEDIAGRTVTTLHGRLDSEDLPGPYRRWPDYPLVSISDAQRAPLPFANWCATVHHGLPESLLRPPMAGGDGYLAFLGRISPEKRPDRAIEIACRAGQRLKIAAKIDNKDRHYFRETIEPMLADPRVELVGEIGDEDKAEFLGNAAALLFPIDWPEPFGLVMIEAMACGTPVIAWPCGSVPEVIDDGTTGFIVRSVEEAVAAIPRLPTLDHRVIRQVFERRFSALAMTRSYLGIYENALDGSPMPSLDMAAE